jgi:hypothetical protein
MNSEISEYLEMDDNGIITVDTGDLEQLGLPYLYSEPMTEAKSKEVVRFVCDNNLQLNDTYCLLKRLIKSIGGSGAYFPNFNSEDGYAEITTNEIVLEFVLKNYKLDDYYPADKIISLVPDPYYNYYELKNHQMGEFK